ncbi:hypothetical protein AK812_SmicGene7689 [Symbiodinium microadriaticum]|uniref:Uncharacterized protein n=1 Tax=Symbiodinium microadriaticum TaxID=2951 RepID=A0A1Q9EN07_SYMMI|nr:hypothetical protein AK812_SmicGene7689 [Symbiodinium microadriaticum]
MLARVLIPAESSGLGPCRYLGYGGSPGRALAVAKVVLQRLPKASLLEVHCPAREAPALQRLASEEPRLRLPSDAQGKGRTFLHTLVTSAEEECQLPLRGVLLDLRGLVCVCFLVPFLGILFISVRSFRRHTRTMESAPAMETQPAAAEQPAEAALPAAETANEAPAPIAAPPGVPMKAPPPSLLAKEEPKETTPAPEIGQLITLSEDLQVVRFTNGIIHLKQKGKDPEVITPSMFEALVQSIRAQANAPAPSAMSGFTGLASTYRGSAPDTDLDPIEWGDMDPNFRQALQNSPELLKAYNTVWDNAEETLLAQVLYLPDKHLSYACYLLVVPRFFEEARDFEDYDPRFDELVQDSIRRRREDDRQQALRMYYIRLYGGDDADILAKLPRNYVDPKYVEEKEVGLKEVAKYDQLLLFAKKYDGKFSIPVRVNAYGSLGRFSGSRTVLPSWSVSWLRKAKQQELAKLFQQHGEQEDDLLWARFAQALEVQKQVCGLQANSDIAGLFRRVAELLKDPAGPAPDGALNALRAALRKEQAVVQDGLRVVLDHLEVGARCILLSDRRDFCIGIRRFLRENEDVDEDLVADWRPHKVASLFPLSQNAEQPWCVAEVTHSAVDPMSAAANLAAKEVFVIEKRLRSSQPRDPVEGAAYD